MIADLSSPIRSVARMDVFFLMDKLVAPFSLYAMLRTSGDLCRFEGGPKILWYKGLVVQSSFRTDFSIGFHLFSSEANPSPEDKK